METSHCKIDNCINSVLLGKLLITVATKTKITLDGLGIAGFVSIYSAPSEDT